MIVYNALPRIARLLSLAIRMMEAMALGCLPSCAWSEFWAHSTWALRRLSPSCRPLRLHWSNMVGGSVAESVDNKIMLCALAHSSFAVERTLGTTRQVLNRQLFSSGQDLQIVIVFIHSHAYCHCRCILSSITYILTAIVMGIRNIQKLSAYQIQS